MSARIDIVNNALTWLGEETITSLEDDSDAALIMKTNYEIARDATLEAHDWSFAIKRWVPAPDPDPPTWGAAYRFKIPSDTLRIIAVERNSAGPIPQGYSSVHSIGRRRQADYVVESGYILTDESGIMVKGIRQIEDEGIYSNLFAHALSAKLAMVTCYALSESNVKFNAMSALYQLQIQEAKTRDGLQGSNKRIRNRSLQDVR